MKNRRWAWMASPTSIWNFFLVIIIIIVVPFTCSSSSPSLEYHYDIVPLFHEHSTLTECDQVFISDSLNITHGSRNGTFIGPTFVIPMPPTSVASTILTGNGTATTTTEVSAESTPATRHTRQCIYTFVAGPNERVHISFKSFSLRSESPECLEEYMDIYAEVRYPDSDLLTTPFGGRYCDVVIPHDRISLYQTLVISFYTAKLFDGSVLNGTELFEGTYQFINATPFVAGTPMPNEVCSYTIYSEIRREGEFMSPTYPGVYPKNITCYYLFKGVKGQRVKLEFMDFDLYFGGPHCPYDYVKIYDGENTQAPLINTYCGQQRQLFVFSSGTTLLMQFTTLKRVSVINQNRGFSGFYEFSEKFVNLGFISNNDNGEHIRGTECDQKIYSRKESNGTIYAPNYPFLYHSNIMCKYFLYGLQDAQNLERINFQFEMLQIPTKDVNECTDAYIRLYTQLLAMDEFDFVFCGETIPPPVVSDGPLLLVVFNSGSTQGQGFKAHYWFETDYKIGGTQASPGQCHFSYVSSGGKSGEFNSPRHPSNYPSNTYCIYEFFGEPDEQVKLVFNHFKFSDSDVTDSGLTGYNDKCTRDWIEVVAVDGNTGKEQYYGRYCGYTAPGPIITEHGVSQIKVIMNTDDNDVSSGFSANYQFDRASEMGHDCGSNFTNLENGIIQTPQYPNSYPATKQICNWFITVKTGSRVLLYFDQFSVEGDPPNRGCSGAIVRVWPDPNEKPIELCGEKLNNASKQYISEFNVLRITFLTAEKAVGAQGFSAIWTEVDMPPASISSATTVPPPEAQPLNRSFGPCPVPPSPTISYPPNNELQSNAPGSQLSIPTGPFQCQLKGYCIAGKLRCNGVQNCGFDDDSDERDCIREVKINLVELVGGMTGLLMFIFFAIGVICLAVILILNWYRRAGDEKTMMDKAACQHYFAQSTPDYSAYYHSEPIGTPHRLIDVMTASSSSGNTPATGAISSSKNVRWPSASNSGDSGAGAGTVPGVTADPDTDLFMDNDGTPGSPPIPPPPPPPSNRSLLTSRQSSLVNFHYGGPPETFGKDHTRSLMGIDQQRINYARGCQTMARNTRPNHESRTSTFSAYPSCKPPTGNNQQPGGVNRRRNSHQIETAPDDPGDSIDSGQMMHTALADGDDESLSSIHHHHQYRQKPIGNQSTTVSATGNGDYLMLMDDARQSILQQANNNNNTTEDESDSMADAGSVTVDPPPTLTSTFASLRKYQMTRLNDSSTTTTTATNWNSISGSGYMDAGNTGTHPSSLIVEE